MTAISARHSRGHTIAGAMPFRERLGVVYPLLLVWLFFEFGRPPYPFKIPLAISLVSLVTWLLRDQKQWLPFSQWWLVLLATAAVGVPLSPNTYASFWTTWNMGILFLAICLPLQSLITSIGRIRVWLLVFLAIALYVGGWAAGHGGYGPSGASGGQDENYVAALMSLAIALAYFSLFAEKAKVVRIAMAAGIVVFVAAIALASNPSRGGFIGLCTVALYCLWRSPRKMLGIGVFTVIAVALFLLAGPSFWAEIGTTTDTTTDTADMRIEIWKAGLRMWQANPFFGVGAGNFRWVIGDYQTVEQLEKFGRSLAGSIIAHSLWVEMLAELGLAGVLATGMLVWRTWTSLGKIRDETMAQTRGPSPDPELVRIRCYADGIRAGILAILANGVFLSLYYYSHLWLLLALGGGLTYLYRSRGLPALAGIQPQPLARARVPAAGRGGLVVPALPLSQGSRVPRRGGR